MSGPQKGQAPASTSKDPDPCVKRGPCPCPEGCAWAAHIFGSLADFEARHPELRAEA